MWEKPYISIFVEIGTLQNFTHFGGQLKNGYTMYLSFLFDCQFANQNFYIQ
jgi:hypothetical protein